MFPLHFLCTQTSPTQPTLHRPLTRSNETLRDSLMKIFSECFYCLTFFVEEIGKLFIFYLDKI